MSQAQEKKIMLSAVQPTHLLTLGNYLGAIKNWVAYQGDFDCLFFAVDLHSITTRQDPEKLRKQTYQTLAFYLAAGIDPKQATLFVQSHVPQHAELSWILSCFSSMGELNRMTQFKDKSSKEKMVSTGLFTYPLLMAADILLYKPHLVPVGEDQKQHVELTRDIALRMNHIYGGDLFRVPEPFIPPVGARIMSLQNPMAKMSKSDPDPNSAIYLSDSDDQILKKLKRAVTDSGSEVTYEDSKPGLKNLLAIQAALLDRTPQEICETYVGKQYGHLKVETAERVISTIGPIRKQAFQLLEDKSYLDSIITEGAAKARQRATTTLSEVYSRVGFLRGRF